MSDSKPLALTLGATSGLALWYWYWYLINDRAKKTAAPAPWVPPVVAAPADSSASTTTGTAAASPKAKSHELGVGPVVVSPSPPCQLQLTDAGLTADGQAIDIPAAVARCKDVGRADVLVTSGAPVTVYARLVAALASANVTVTPRRNGRTRPHRTRRRQHTHDVELADFAATVSALAQQIEPDPSPEGLARGRFGVRKVFIAAIRRALRETALKHLPRATVDALLVEAMRERLLRLARVDVAAALDPAEVRDSEVRSVNATYHFVISEPPDGVDVRRSTTAKKR